MANGFQEKLNAAAEQNQSLLCVGLDPDPSLMPIADVLEFNKAIIDATKKWEYPAVSLPPSESLGKVINNWDQYDLPALDEVRFPKGF